MRTPLFFNGQSTPAIPNNADRFCTLAGGGTTTTAFTLPASRAAGISPISGTIRRLAVRWPTAITQGSYQVTLLEGVTSDAMTETNLRATVTPGDLTPLNLVNRVAIVAGRFYCWRVRPTDLPEAPSGSIQIASVFDAAVDGESLIWGFTFGNATFGGLGIGVSSGTTAENSATVVLPTAGTISNVNVNLTQAAPGTGNSRTFNLRKGTAYGALSGTANSVTISDTATTGADATAVSFAAGDLANFGLTSTGSPASSNLVYTAKWVPDVAGEALAFGALTPSISNTATRFAPFSGSAAGSESTNANVGNIAPIDLTVKRLRIATPTAPGGVGTRTATLQKDGTNTGLTATLNPADTTAVTDTDIAISAGETINSELTRSGTVAGTNAFAFGSVLVASTAPEPVGFSTSNRNGDTFEGVRNPISKIVVEGFYSGSPTDVQVALFDAAVGGTQVAAWASATVQADGEYRHTFAGLSVGGPYYQRLRDNGGTETLTAIELYVGAIVPFWGQSQQARLFSQDVLSPVVTSTNVRILSTSDITDVGSSNITITRLSTGMPSIAGVTGSGAVAFANQWHADVGASVPLLMVDMTYSGTSIQSWINDLKGDTPTNSDVTTLFGTSPTTGLVWHLADAVNYQATAILWMQGTSDVNAPGTYAGFMDTLRDKFNALFTGTTLAPLMCVQPHQRSVDGNNTFNMRNVQFAKASSGGTWRVLASMLDHVMDVDGSPHQKDGATGNIRLGTRLGRGAASVLIDDTLDNRGPRIVRANFSDGTRNIINIDFDRDLSLADGTVFAGSAITLPAGWSTSVDSGTAFTAIPAPDHAAAIVSARRVQLTKTTGSWPTGTTRVDYLRGTPYSSQSGHDDFVGTEANMEANYFSKVITDTSAFDGGRGMPFAPPMASGFAVAEPGAATTFGPFTLTVEDADGETASLSPFNITVSP